LWITLLLLQFLLSLLMLRCPAICSVRGDMGIGPRTVARTRRCVGLWIAPV